MAHAAAPVRVAGNRVWMGFDSQTIRTGQTLPLAFADTQPAAWAGIISNQRIWFEGIAATGGYTTSDVINTVQASGLTWLQTVVRAKPAVCIVLIGTNDVGTGVARATTIANLTTIFRTLKGAGITPAICTLLPRVAFLSGIHALNVWLRRYALVNGLPFIDFYTPMVDPTTGGLKAAYDFGDGLHQNPAGAKVMGQAINDALIATMPPWLPALPVANTDASGINTNPLFLTDTNADGIPDNWGISGAGATSVLTTDAGVVGNVWRVTRGANDLLLFSTLQTVPVGHVMEITGRIRCTLLATGSSISVRATGGTSVVEEAAPFGRAASRWFQDITPWATFYSRYVVKANNANARMQVDLVGASGGQVELAQVIQRDLTALGVDTP